MDELLSEQLEWLLAQNGSSGRFGRQIITLIGFLSEDSPPENISRQTLALSRQVMLRDLFDALVGSLNVYAQNQARPKSDATPSTGNDQYLTPLIAQIEAVRLDLSQCEPINHAELIAWIVARARQRKLLRDRRTRR